MSSEWLNDPEWDDLRRKVNGRKKRHTGPNSVDGVQEVAWVRPLNPRPAKTRSVESEKVKVSFDVSIPKLRLPKFHVKSKAKALIKDKRQAKGIVLVGLSAVFLVSMVLFSRMQTPAKTNVKDEAPGVAASAQGNTENKPVEPQFAMLLPEGKKDNITNGEFAFNVERQVLNYRDKLAGIDITVSQQQLPENFKQNTKEQLSKMAKDFNATEIVTTKTSEAYLGQSIKGPQTAIFSRDGLLIFIQSTAKIDNSDWILYIDELK